MLSFMKLTTIQITSEEDKVIGRLKKELGLPTKKAVVMEGLQALKQTLKQQKRTKGLQAASRLVRRESLRTTQEWGPLGTATKSS